MQTAVVVLSGCTALVAGCYAFFACSRDKTLAFFAYLSAIYDDTMLICALTKFFLVVFGF